MSAAPEGLHEVDAGTLKLRADRPQPKRLSRKALMSGTAVMGSVIAFALLSGLSPRTRNAAAQTDNSVSAAATLPEGLNALPAQYSAATSQTQTQIDDPGDINWTEGAASDGFDPYTSEHETALDQQERFGWSGNSGLDAPPPQVDRSTATESEVAPLFFEPRKNTLTRSGGVADRDVSSPPYIEPDGRSTTAASGRAALDRMQPASPYTVQSGTIIPAALMTAINSDLPGRVIAQVTMPVYDSVTGDHLLIPQGTRLIGTYSSENRYGDTRVFLAWNRMILPNGWSVDLGEMEATDPAGASGLPSRVDNHLDRVGGAIAVSALLSILANEAENDDEHGFGRSLGDAAAQEAARTGSRIVDRELNLRPTLKAKPGAPVRVLVTDELLLEPYTE